ncbi:hypothetical protein CRG98_018343 [Punica granatum]|nr:hypothetical protein CRG98_018343 [Punica granatum]
MAHAEYGRKSEGKKTSFERNWKILTDNPKWANSFTANSGGSKRTKTSASRQYSSSSNLEQTHPVNDAVESPVHPQGNKAAKRKAKGKSKTSGTTERYDKLKMQVARRLSLIEDFNKENERENDHAILIVDTSIMTDEQQEIHVAQVDEN